MTRSAGSVRLWAGIVLFLIFLSLPGAPDSSFSGLPLTGWALAWVAAILVVILFGLLFPPTGTPPRWLVAGLVLALVVKIGLLVWSVPAGWRGVYTLNGDTVRQPIVFSAGVRRQPFRLDRRIDFDQSNFELTFLNDVLRYRQQFGVTRRDFEVPFAVEWTGFVFLRHPEAVELEVASRGSLRVQIDGQPWLEGSALDGTAPGRRVLLPAGLHEIRVRYEKPAKTEPLVRVGVREAGSGQPIVVSAEPTSLIVLRANRVVTGATTGLGGVAAILLGLVVLTVYWSPATLRALREGPDRLAVWLSFAAVLTRGLVAALPFQHQTVTLWAGDDPLVYEGNARDILFHGLLMPTGFSTGHGVAFYHYPLYSYALALAHLFLGESFSTVVFFNFACLAAAIPLAWLLGFRGMARVPAAIGAVLTAAFLLRHLGPYAMSALTDVLFTAMVLAALAACVAALERERRELWWLAGVLSALAAATRPSLLVFLGLFPAVLVLVRVRRDGDSRWRKAFWFLFGAVSGLFPFALRNWIMAHKLVVLVDSWIMLPYFLYPPGQPNPIDGRPGLLEALRMVADIVRSRPVDVMVTELKKVAFTLGMTKVFGSWEAVYVDLLVLPVLFGVSLVLRRVPAMLAVTLGAFAVSHLLAMVLAAPWTYGYKSIVPLHLAFLVGAVHLLPGGSRGVTRKATKSARSEEG